MKRFSLFASLILVGCSSELEGLLYEVCSSPSLSSCRSTQQEPNEDSVDRCVTEAMLVLETNPNARSEEDLLVDLRSWEDCREEGKRNFEVCSDEWIQNVYSRCSNVPLTCENSTCEL